MASLYSQKIKFYNPKPTWLDINTLCLNGAIGTLFKQSNVSQSLHHLEELATCSWEDQKSSVLGPWRWSSGQRSGLLLRQSEFDSSGMLIVLYWEKMKINEKRGWEWFISKKRAQHLAGFEPGTSSSWGVFSSQASYYMMFRFQNDGPGLDRWQDDDHFSRLRLHAPLGHPLHWTAFLLLT